MQSLPFLGMIRSAWPRLRGAIARRSARTWCDGSAWIAQPFEDQVRVHRVAKRHLRNRNAGRSRLQADRPLLLIRPKPPRPSRHAITIVSTIVGGHYPPLSPGGRAVRPDAYGTTPYPTGITRGFRLFVDILLTRRVDSKKPRWMAGRMSLMTFRETGCGGRI